MRNWLRSLVEAEVCDSAAFLNLCRREGIPLADTESRDGCRLRFSAPPSALVKLKTLAQRCGGSLRVLRSGIGERLRGKTRRHGAILLAAALMGLLLLCSSLFLWEIEPGGCPDTAALWRILAALDRAGLRRGAFIPTLSTELLCSEALGELPELESLTVNLRGSRAYVEARGRSEEPEIALEKGESVIVADRQALLTDVRVLAGTAAVNRGMAVEAGDVLVLPSSTAERARGEITGLCRLEKTVILPQSVAALSHTGKTRTIWGLQWGKRCIFLQTDSSISPTVCGKIYSASSSALPLGLCRLTLEERESTEPVSGTLCEVRYAEALLEKMLAQELGKEGELLTAAVNRSGNSVSLRCECSLPIGVERSAE